MTQISFQRACLWGGPICLALFFGAFFAAGFIPPPSPSDSVAEITGHYRDHTTGIRVGSALMLLAGMFYVAYSAAIAGQLRRIPDLAPAVRYTVLGAGTLACVTFLVPALMFAVASFRPGRSPELTLQFNDMAWIFTIMPFPPFMVQYYAFAFAILTDPRPRPLFARWVAYLNLWAPLVYTTAILVPFFKTGPFSWSGAITFWLAGVVFSTQFIVNFIALRRAIDDEAHELDADHHAGRRSPLAASVAT